MGVWPGHSFCQPAHCFLFFHVLFLYSSNWYHHHVLNDNDCNIVECLCRVVTGLSLVIGNASRYAKLVLSLSANETKQQPHRGGSLTGCHCGLVEPWWHRQGEQHLACYARSDLSCLPLYVHTMLHPCFQPRLKWQFKLCLWPWPYTLSVLLAFRWPTLWSFVLRTPDVCKHESLPFSLPSIPCVMNVH